MEIRLDNLRSPEVIGLLNEHLHSMAQHSPPESVHALDVDGLRRPEVSFWSAWEGAELLGCGAIKQLDATHGEIKSMRTASAHLRKGVAAALLQHIMVESGKRRYRRLSLETGSAPAFAPARSMYTRFGFVPCEPFADYVPDPHSVFMTRTL